MHFFLGAGNDQKARAGRGVGRVGRGRLGEGNREGEMGRGAMGREGKEVGMGRQGWGKGDRVGAIGRGDFTDEYDGMPGLT